MNVLHWLIRPFFNRSKALSVYRRGMASAKKHDHQMAINDYTETISMRDTPADVKAMALYNRALVYAAIGEDTKVREDLSEVLTMSDAPTNVRTEARRMIVRMQRRSSSSNT